MGTNLIVIGGGRFRNFHELGQELINVCDICTALNQYFVNTAES